MTCFNVSVCEGKEAGGCGFFFCVLLRKMIKRPEGAQMKILIFLSQISIPLVIFYIVAYGLVNKCKVYEEFVKGDEIVIESVVVDDAVHLLICGDTYYFDIPDAFAAKQRIFPSQKDITIIKAASELNEKIIKGFGLKTGLTHGEYIIKDGKVYLLEIAARGGGVFISSDIIPLMTGFDTTSFIIDTAAGIRPDFKLSKPVYACACYLAFFLPEGEILSIDGVDKVKSMPNVYHHNLDSFYIGEKIRKNTDKTTRGFVVIAGPDFAVLKLIINEIRSILSINVVNNGIIRNIIWD